MAKTKKKYHYKSKFNKTWLEDPLLQVWIQPSTEEGQTAYCPYCEGHLNGSKTLMLRHARNHKHIKNMNSKGVKNATIEQHPMLFSKISTVRIANAKDESVDISIQSIKKSLISKEKTLLQLPQRWLEDPVLNSWIAPPNEMGFVAYCTICKQDLKGKKKDMKQHALVHNTEDLQVTVSKYHENNFDTVNKKCGQKKSKSDTLSCVSKTYQIKHEPEEAVTDIEEGDGFGSITEEENEYEDEVESNEEDGSNDESISSGRRQSKSSLTVQATLLTGNEKTIFLWQKDPKLRKWLKASSLPGYKAFCKWCSCDLQGDKEDMLKHASSENHKRNSKRKKKHYDHKFNPDWLSDPNLKSWIAQSKTKTAYCKKCNRHLKGSKTMMYRHAHNPRHMRSIATAPKDDDEVKAVLRVCAFIAEHDLSPGLMNHFPLLLKAVAVDSDIAKTLDCTPEKTEFFIKNVLAIDRLNDLSNKLTSTVFSIIVDESTDIFQNKSLSLVVRYYDEDTRNVEDSFLTIIDVTDSNNLIQSIIDFFTSINVPLSNLLGFAADSVNVLVGKYSSTQIRLRQINPSVHISGCVHHSFQYCVSEASSKFPETYEKLCHDINDYLHFMPQQVAGFEQIYPLFSLEIQDMIKYSNIRWLSVSQVVTNLVDNWDTLVSYFNICAASEHDTKAQQILILLTDPVTKLVFLFMNFFLPTVDDLNLEFQGSKYCLHSLLSTIGEKVKMILKFYMKASYVNETSPSDLNPVDEKKFLVLENMYFGTRVEALTLTMDSNTSYEMILHFKGHCLNFYMEFCTQLLERVNFKDPVLKYLYMLNPEICKSDLYISIRPMAMLFPNVIEHDMLDELESEWWNIKSSSELSSTEDFLSFWNQVFEEPDENTSALRYPLMTKLVKALLCLPHSSEATKDTFTAVRKNNIKPRDKHDSAMMSSLILIKEKLKGTTSGNFEVSDALLCLAKSSLCH